MATLDLMGDETTHRNRRASNEGGKFRNKDVRRPRLRRRLTGRQPALCNCRPIRGSFLQGHYFPEPRTGAGPAPPSSNALTRRAISALPSASGAEIEMT